MEWRYFYPTKHSVNQYFINSYKKLLALHSLFFCMAPLVLTVLPASTLHRLSGPPGVQPLASGVQLVQFALLDLFCSKICKICFTNLVLSKKSSTFADFFTRAHNAAHTLGVHIARTTTNHTTRTTNNECKI